MISFPTTTGSSSQIVQQTVDSFSEELLVLTEAGNFFKGRVCIILM